MPLTNKQFDEIQRIYDAKQNHNRQILKARSKEAYARVPLLAELDERSGALSLKKARIRLMGPTGSDQDFDLQAALEDIILERKAALAAGGFSPDYLDSVYECALCKDTGFIEGKKCTCFKQAEIALLYARSNLGEILDTENFDHFSLNWYDDVDPARGISHRQMAEEAYHASKAFVEHFDHTFENLCFQGNTGVGKTFLSHCIARELMNTGHSVLYLTAFDLFDLLEKNKFAPDEDIRESCSHIFDCDLLIIDDLGTELTNAFISSRLFLVINERILRKSSTIISTNLSLDQLADTYSERTFSRILSHYQILRLFGNDIRIQKQLSGGI